MPANERIREAIRASMDRVNALRGRSTQAIPRQPSTYGKKGDVGPNAGKRASTYTGYYMNGKLTKRTFKKLPTQAWFGCYRRNGEVLVAGVWTEMDKSLPYFWVPAWKAE